METKIMMSVDGVDLTDEETLVTLARHFDDLGWTSVGGRVTVTLYTEDPDPIAVGAETARVIQKHLKNVAVVRVDDQLVGISDIAARLDMTDEGVRMWARGERRKDGLPFPSPRGQVGKGKNVTKVWVWTDVVCWLRSECQLDPEDGVRLLSHAETTRLNSLLLESARDTARYQADSDEVRLPTIPAQGA